MTTPKELNNILTDCCERLVECTSIIEDIQLEPKRKNIYKVGKALAEISELRTTLYNKHPSLKPENWGEPATEEDFSEWLEEAVMVAEEYVKEGNPKKAIETYEAYISIGPSEHYINIAKNNILELRGKYNV